MEKNFHVKKDKNKFENKRKIEFVSEKQYQWKSEMNFENVNAIQSKCKEVLGRVHISRVVESCRAFLINT